jgi:hypothetical protein
LLESKEAVYNHRRYHHMLSQQRWSEATAHRIDKNQTKDTNADS